MDKVEEMVKVEYTAPDGTVYALGSKRDDWPTWERFVISTKFLFRSNLTTMLKVNAVFDLHPEVQRLADKGYEVATLDEMAIVNTMRRSLADSFANFQQIKIWLQQENPLNLTGLELAEWATDVASWVLPTQLRRQDATATGKLKEGSQQQHQEGDSSRQASEASSSNRPQ